MIFTTFVFVFSASSENNKLQDEITVWTPGSSWGAGHKAVSGGVHQAVEGGWQHQAMFGCRHQVVSGKGTRLCQEDGSDGWV